MNRVKIILPFILALILLKASSAFAQTNTFNIEKPGVVHSSNMDITIGGRVVHDKDTISLSLVVQTGGIGLRDTVREDYFITSFDSSIPLNAEDAVWGSNSWRFPPNTMNLLDKGVNRMGLYIGKVCYRASGKNFMIIKSIYLTLIVPKAPKPPPSFDTITQWESKFNVSIANHSEGTITKKELLKAKQVDISGPVDSMVITHYDITFQYPKAFKYDYSNTMINTDILSSNSSILNKEILALIKKAPANTTIVISGIGYTSGKNDYNHGLSKNLSLLIQ